MKATILSLALSLSFFAITLRAIRRKQLRELHAVLWLGLSLAMILMSIAIATGYLDSVAKFVGIAYPPDLVWLISSILLVLLVLQLSISQTREDIRQKTIAQEIGLMKSRLSDLEALIRQADSSDDEPTNERGS